MQRVCDPPGERSRWFRGELEAIRGYFLSDEFSQARVQFTRSKFAECIGVIREIFFERIPKGGFFANLERRPPAPIHINRNGRHILAFHPAREIGCVVESETTRKDLPETVAGASDHLPEERVHVAVDVAEECQVKRVNRNGTTTVGASIEKRVVLEDEQARVMNVLERGERNQRVVRIETAEGEVHRVQ